MICVECEKEGKINNYVVNKIHKLCDRHNKARLYSFVISPPVKKSLKQVSIKESINRDNLKIVYKEIEQERKHICSGCGNKNNLSHSQLIPRSRRKDLETDKENIQYHCLIGIDGGEGCHSKWESNLFKKMDKMLDFINNMEYIKKTDSNYYNFIFSKNGGL